MTIDSEVGGASVWRNYACKVEVSADGGVCLQIYNRDHAGERWAHSQLGSASLEELGKHVAILMDEVERRGFAKGQEHVRVALGFPGGTVRR